MNVLSGEGVYTSIFDIKFNTVDKFKLNFEIVHLMVSYCNLPLNFHIKGVRLWYILAMIYISVEVNSKYHR